MRSWKSNGVQRLWRWSSWSLIVVVVGLVGCGRSAAKPEQAPPNLMKIQVLYSVYMLHHSGVGPHDVNEFKRFIRAEGANEAKRLEVDLTDLDSLFVSPRDGRPYQINYGLRQANAVRERPVMVSESKGRDGKRAVGFVGGWIEKVDPDKAAQLGLPTS